MEGKNRIVYVPRPAAAPASASLAVGASSVSARPSAASSASSSAAPGEAEAECLTCVQPMDYVSLGACNHRYVCPSCSLKMRKMCKNNRCIICKANQDIVIFTKEKERDFDNFDTSQMVRIQGCGVFFDDKTIEDRCRDLLSKKCPKCSIKPFKELNDLRSHMKDAHGLYYCTVCLQHEKNYLSEQKVFTKREMDDHLRGSKGHPFCQFCNKHFYDSDALFYHCEGQHNSCVLCSKSTNTQQYFRDVHDLVDHFRETHFLCEDPLCIERTMAGEFLAAFRDEIDLTAHRLEKHSEHGGVARGKKHVKLSIPIGVPSSSTSSLEREREIGGGEGGRKNKKSKKKGGSGGSSSSSSSSLPHVDSQTVSINSFSSPASSSSQPSASSASSSSAPETSAKNAKKKPSGPLAPLEEQVKSVRKIVDLPPISEEETKRRNKEMITKMRSIIGPEGFKNFKEHCPLFYNGTIDAKTFFDVFVDCFGANALSLFEESAVLLPDKEKQSQLLTFILNNCPTSSLITTVSLPSPSPSPSSSSDSSRPPVSLHHLSAKTRFKVNISDPTSTPSSSVPSPSPSPPPSLAVPANDEASFPRLGAKTSSSKTSVAVSASSLSFSPVSASVAAPAERVDVEKEFPSLPVVSVPKKEPAMTYSDTANRKALVSHTDFSAPVEQEFPALPAKSVSGSVAPSSTPSWGPGAGPKKKKNRSGGGTFRYRL